MRSIILGGLLPLPVRFLYLLYRINPIADYPKVCEVYLSCARF
jgi:hypothetical protein